MEDGKLTAVYPILYHSHQYQVGDELPTNDPEMTALWLEAGTAAYISPTDSAIEAVAARPVTAEAGLPGEAVGPEKDIEGDLVGKVPKTTARSKKKG